MPNIAHRQKSTRNNEFLKYVSTGAGLGQIKHVVLEREYFPELPVDEGMNRIATKRLARKGQVIVKHADTERWGPLARSEAEAAVSADTEIVVADASVFGVGSEVSIAGVTGTRTVTAVDLDTNTLTLSAALGANVSADAAVTVAGLGADYTDMAVLGDEFDLTYGNYAGPGYHLNCFFNVDNLYGYAGNEAEVQAGLPTCFFETLPDVTDV